MIDRITPRSCQSCSSCPKHTVIAGRPQLHRLRRRTGLRSTHTSRNFGPESGKTATRQSASGQRKTVCFSVSRVRLLYDVALIPKDIHVVALGKFVSNHAHQKEPPAPTTAWRSALARAVVSAHGVLLFSLFSAPLLLLVVSISKTAYWPSLAAGAAAVGTYVGVLCVPNCVFEIRSRQRATYGRRWLKLKKFRSVVGFGDGIQSVARSIDPDWRNPLMDKTSNELSKWFLAMEKFHWASLLSSLPIMTLAFYFDRTIFGYIYIVANVLYNALPILLQRFSRMRVIRIAQRESRHDGLRDAQD